MVIYFLLQLCKSVHFLFFYVCTGKYTTQLMEGKESHKVGKKSQKILNITPLLRFNKNKDKTPEIDRHRTLTKRSPMVGNLAREIRIN